MNVRTLLLIAGLAILAPAGATAHDDRHWGGRDWPRYESRNDKRLQKQMRERAKAQRKADRAWQKYNRRHSRNDGWYGYGDRFHDRSYGEYRRYPRDRYYRRYRFR